MVRPSRRSVRCQTDDDCQKLSGEVELEKSVDAEVIEMPNEVQDDNMVMYM